MTGNRLVNALTKKKLRELLAGELSRKHLVPINACRCVLAEAFLVILGRRSNLSVGGGTLGIDDSTSSSTPLKVWHKHVISEFDALPKERYTGKETLELLGEKCL